MKRWIKWLVVLGVLAGGVRAATGPAIEYWRNRNQPQWRYADVQEGDIISVVNATGKVRPVRKITVGSFVSGPIDTSVRMVGFNEEVQKGQVLCKIDPRIYKANLDRDEATLKSRQAEVRRADAQLQQSRRDLDRAIKLREEDKSFIAQAEMDKFIEMKELFTTRSSGSSLGSCREQRFCPFNKSQFQTAKSSSTQFRRQSL